MPFFFFSHGHSLGTLEETTRRIMIHHLWVNDLSSWSGTFFPSSFDLASLEAADKTILIENRMEEASAEYGVQIMDWDMGSQIIQLKSTSADRSIRWGKSKERNESAKAEWWLIKRQTHKDGSIDRTQSWPAQNPSNIQALAFRGRRAVSKMIVILRKDI